MTRILLVSICLITMILVGPAIAGMQHRMGGQMPMGTQSEAQESSPGQQPMRGHGMMGRGMMGHGMMGVMCPMMAMMMDPSGMGMMGEQQIEPKMVGRMLQLRGDMLKAIGDVLLKHGKAMEEAH
jgi:hypothetical protein